MHSLGTVVPTPGSTTLGFLGAHECRKFLKELWELPETKEFRLPVDTELYPSYKDIIQKPMDLKTIESKLDSNIYCSISEFVWDMRLIWRNAKNFNKPGSKIWKNAKLLAEICDKKFLKINTDSMDTSLPKTLSLKRSKIKRLLDIPTSPQVSLILRRKGSSVSPPKKRAKKTISLQDDHLTLNKDET